METSGSQKAKRAGEEATKKLKDLIADARSAAFGICKLTPAQFNDYSIAEINEIIASNITHMNEEHRFLDMLNARKCEVIAKCAGVKNVKAVEFLILKREPEKLKFESPQEMALKLAMMGG